jgi:hypothetical protein
VPPSNMNPNPPDAPDDPGWEPVDDDFDPLPVAYPARMRRVTRVVLVGMAATLTAVFAAAAWIRPYDDAGNPQSMATHTQLGLPECSMVRVTGKPCPACGMTTSFSLLVHGDLWSSMKANWVGTLLAAFWLALIPWGLVSAFRGRLVWVRNADLFATVAVGVTLTLMMARWGWIILRN